MFGMIQNILLVFLEIMCCKIFYETFGEVRHNRWLNTIWFLLLLGSICFLAYVFSEHFIIRQAASILVLSVLMFWHVKISLKKSFVLAVLFDALLLAMDYLMFLILGWMALDRKLQGQQYETGGILVYLLGKVILFIIILVIRKQFRKKSVEMMMDTEWLRFLFFPVFTIVAISAMLSVFQYVQTVEQANLLAVIAFGMVGLNIIVFYLINDILKREMEVQEKRVLQVQAQNQMEMYKTISENQKRKTHEYKNQITCIESLLGEKQYPELEEYIKKINGSLNGDSDTINTNNVIVNAILNAKYREADSKKIVFAFRVNDLSGLKIGDEDIVTILANLLNNAIEACEKCSGKKVIKFKFIREDDLTVISVKNTFNGVLIYENGVIKSTKTADEGEHGVGIKNITRTVEKYDGSYVMEEQGQEFYFSIVIPS